MEEAQESRYVDLAGIQTPESLGTPALELVLGRLALTENGCNLLLLLLALVLATLSTTLGLLLLLLLLLRLVLLRQGLLTLLLGERIVPKASTTVISVAVATTIPASTKKVPVSKGLYISGETRHGTTNLGSTQLHICTLYSLIAVHNSILV